MKRSQQDQERAVLRYRSIMEASLDGIIIIDSDGYLVECNNAFLRNLGYTREEARRLHVCDWNAEWSREKIAEMIQSFMSESATFDTRHRRKDGSLIDVEINATSMKLDGKLHLCNAVRDITERKRHESALHDSEQRYLNVLQASRDAILLLDGERFIECNEATCRMLGYATREEFLMVHPSKLSPPTQPDGRDSYEKAEEMIKTAFKEGYNRFEWLHRKANGEDFPVEVSLTPITLQGKNLLQSHWHDITELKRTTAELREKDRRLQLFAENINETIWTMNALGQFLYVSPSVERMLGFAPEEFVQLSFGQLMTAESAEIASHNISGTFSLVDAGCTLSPRTLELEFCRKDGSSMWVEVNYNGMYDESGRFICLQGIARDITERRQSEQRHSNMLRQLEGLYFLQQSLVLPSHLEEKLNMITDSAVGLLDLDFCRIWMVRPGDLCNSGCIHSPASNEKHICPNREKCLHLLASSGRYTHLNGNHRRVPLGYYKIGQIATGEMDKFLTNNVTTDPRVHNHEWASSLGLVSFAGYKLLDRRDAPIGVLAAFKKQVFSASDDALMEDLARKTSQVIIDSQLNEDLLQAQKLEGVGQLAGGIAHEFNNLLQVIEGYTRYGMKGLDPEENRCRDLQRVLQATDRAANLTRQLLGFSRRKAMQPQNVDANRSRRGFNQAHPARRSANSLR